MSEKRRIQFDIAIDTLEEIDDIQKKLHLSSRGEVIRNAIAVLKWVTKELIDHGGINANSITIERERNIEYVEVKFPFLAIK